MRKSPKDRPAPEGEGGLGPYLCNRHGIRQLAHPMGAPRVEKMIGHPSFPSPLLGNARGSEMVWSTKAVEQFLTDVAAGEIQLQ